MAVSEAERKWRNTPKGYINRVYGNIKQRCKDPKRPKYNGLPVMTWDEFIKWGLTPELITMHAAYLASNKDRKLAPSVDRIDPSKGYVAGNIQWLTQSDNSKRAGKAVKIPLFSFQILINKY